jgi:DNA-binding protein H-NS
MSSIDLNALSVKELKQLQRDVEKAIASFEDRQKSEARAKLEEQARAMGFTLAELLEGVEVKKTRAPAQAKYQHPENPSLTWSGRGRKPQWFTAAIAAGKTPEDLSI